MTDLLHTVPDFPTQKYTHLIPSLEKSLITTTDLLTLDALDVAKRAQLPLLEVRRLKEHILAILQGELGLDSELHTKFDNVGKEKPGYGILRKNGQQFPTPRGFISTLDPALDKALGGGIQTGYVTEIVGESGAGKTQLLLTLLLSAQLPPHTARPTCYISTEHPLPTPRLTQILTHNPTLLSSTTTPFPPSLSRILTLQTPDLESQEHILTYQLPHALATQKIGLVVIDSVAANYRAETLSTSAAALAARSAKLVKLGGLLRGMAREFGCAVVVANQVSDRFGPPPVPQLPISSWIAKEVERGGDHPLSSPAAAAASSPAPSTATTTTTTTAPASTLLTLDHQQRFFTGWGDAPPYPHPPYQPHNHNHNLKTPTLGLVWANQISARIALIKEEAVVLSHQQQQQQRGEGGGEGGRESAEWTVKRWRRWMRVVFAPWVEGVAGGGGGWSLRFGGGV